MEQWGPPTGPHMESQHSDYSLLYLGPIVTDVVVGSLPITAGIGYYLEL